MIKLTEFINKLSDKTINKNELKTNNGCRQS